MSKGSDIPILRDLASRYVELAQHPVQDERRALWRRHNSLLPTRPLVLVMFGFHNAWVRERFGEGVLLCQDPLFRFRVPVNAATA